jgi:DNA invertase Pin-like site-specific DNA recombinase
MLGVTRQLEDCRAEAERRGWTVAEEYVDDDTSAYSGKSRPAYERMLADLRDGLRDAVIVWHLDRLHRRPIELEQFADICAKAGVKDLVTLHGQVDLAQGDGLLVARMMAAVAASESDAKSRRIKRKFLEVAESGAPYMGGGHRPFGFERDRITHRTTEADVLREAAARILAGESLGAVARDLDGRGVTGSKGSRMTGTALRTLLLRPRNHGMRVHEGQVIGLGTWEPIISAEDGERLRLLLTDPARRTNRAARRYVLSGLVRCGNCGARMASASRESGRRYVCGMLTTANVPCQRVMIQAEPLEALIAAAVLLRLDSPELMTALTRTDDGARVSGLGDEISADMARMEDLAKAWADGDFSREEWKVARDRIEARLEANRRALARMTRRDAIENYIGQGESLRAAWDTLNLSQQAAIVKAVVDHITVHPFAKPGQRHFDPSRVDPAWRL